MFGICSFFDQETLFKLLNELGSNKDRNLAWETLTKLSEKPEIHLEEHLKKAEFQFEVKEAIISEVIPNKKTDVKKQNVVIDEPNNEPSIVHENKSDENTPLIEDNKGDVDEDESNHKAKEQEDKPGKSPSLNKETKSNVSSADTNFEIQKPKDHSDENTVNVKNNGGAKEEPNAAETPNKNPMMNEKNKMNAASVEQDPKISVEDDKVDEKTPLNEEYKDTDTERKTNPTEQEHPTEQMPQNSSENVTVPSARQPLHEKEMHSEAQNENANETNEQSNSTSTGNAAVMIDTTSVNPNFQGHNTANASQGQSQS